MFKRFKSKNWLSKTFTIKFILQFNANKSLKTAIENDKMSHGWVRKVPKNCHVLFEWPLMVNFGPWSKAFPIQGSQARPSSRFSSH